MALTVQFYLTLTGVTLYFLISGFLAYSSVKNATNIKEYAIKRMVRILPTYYVSLLLTFILEVFITKELPLSPLWLYHVVFLNMSVPNSEWMWWNSVNFFWTMPSFIAWYILSPMIFRYLKSSREIFIGTILLVLITPFLKKWLLTFASDQFVNWNFFCLLYVFFMGALAWFVIDEKKQVLGIGYAISLALTGWSIGTQSGFFVFGLLFYVLIVCMSMIKMQFNNKNFQNGVILMSNISYSVYLSHYFVLKATDNLWTQMHWTISYLLFIVCAGFVGFVLHNFIEKPSIKWLNSKAMYNPKNKNIMNAKKEICNKYPK